MKLDICLNGNKYLVEIDDSVAKIVSKEPYKEQSDDLDIPDFDFGEETENNEGNTNITAALPGTVVVVEVKEGEKVSKGQTLLILESMKMENAIAAPFDCLIEKVFVKVGNYVTKDQELVSYKSVE